MVSNQQRISLMKIQIESLEKNIKDLRKEIKEIKSFNSIISCEYFIDGKSYKLNRAIAKLIDSQTTGKEKSQ